MTFIQTLGLSWSTKHSYLKGAEHPSTNGRKCLLPNVLKIFLSPAPPEGPSRVLFVRIFMDSESQDATKITSALTDSRTYSFTKMMTLYMCIVEAIVFVSVSLFSQCCDKVDVKTRWSLQNNRWTKHSFQQAERIENYFYEFLAFSSQTQC